MGRKKTVEANSDAPIDVLSQLESQLEDKFGEGIFSTCQSIRERNKTIIPIGPVLNRLAGGGITSGSWSVFTGAPKIGKTTSALCAAANAQKVEYGYLDPLTGVRRGRRVYYGDIEGRLKSRDLSGIPGLNTDPEWFRIIGSTPDKTLSAEDFLFALDLVIKTDPGAFVIIDSISLLAEERRLAEYGVQTRGGQAKAVSDFCARNATVVPVKDTIVIAITHQISNTSGYGPSTIEKTPSSLRYAVDAKFKGTRVEAWTNGQDDEPHGQIITWVCECSALRGPGRKGQSYIRYGSGIDVHMENIMFGVDLGLISKKGSWYTTAIDGVEDDRQIKAQGTESLRAELIKNLEIYDLLEKQVLELIQ